MKFWRRATLGASTLVFSSLLNWNSWAHEGSVTIVKSTAACDGLLRANTLHDLRERARQRNSALARISPPVDFMDLAGQSLIEHAPNPRSPGLVNDMMPAGIGVVAVPPPTSSDPVSMGLIEEKYTRIVHVTTEWAGRTRTTAAYITLPGAKIRSAGDYPVGPENPAVVAYLHGGATTSSGAKNSTGLGTKLAERGFATVAIDLFGHGLGTKDLTGLEDVEKQMNFILKVLNQLIHPSVPRVGVGHSWGAQLWNYGWRHSDEAKYAKFEHFFMLSPVIDASGRGDLRYNVEFEKNMVINPDDVAATDKKFLENFLRNKKDSEIGRIAYLATNRGYATPPLSPERQRQIKPGTTLVGRKDAVVFAGIKDSYRASHAGLEPPSSYTELDAGPTFDGVREIGHDVFPLLNENGRFFIYGLIGDYLRDLTHYEPFRIVKEDTPTEKKTPNLIAGIQINFPRLIGANESTVVPEVVRKRLDVLREYVRDYDSISKLGEKERKPREAPVAKAYAELMAPELIDQHYRNFPGFRELVEHDVQRVETRSIHSGELSLRRRAIDQYIKDTAELRTKHESLLKRTLDEKVQELAASLGLPKSYDLARAREEIAFTELTPDRRSALQDVIDKANTFTANQRRDDEPEFVADVARLSAEYADALLGLGITIDQYPDARKQFGKKGKYTAQQNQWRKDLDNLHNDFRDAKARRVKRSEDELGKALEPYLRRAGVYDVKTAYRELEAVRSEERRHALATFIANVPKIEDEVTTEANLRLNQLIASLPRPDGVDQSVDLTQIKADHDNLMALTYAPPGSGLDDLVRRIAEATLKRDEALKGTETDPGLDVLAKSFEALHQERAREISAWSLLWEQNLFGSPRTDADAARLLELETTFEASHKQWMRVAADHELDLHERDQYTMDSLIDRPPEVRAAFEAYANARAAYWAERGTLERSRIAEAQLGNLQPRLNLDGEALATATRATLEAVGKAREIYGPHPLHSSAADDDSMTRRLQKLGEDLLAKRREYSLKSMLVAELRYNYVTAMRAGGHQYPVDVFTVEMAEHLNSQVGLVEVLDRMEQEPRLTQGFEMMLREWNELLKLLRDEHNRGSDAGEY